MCVCVLRCRNYYAAKVRAAQQDSAPPSSDLLTGADTGTAAGSLAGVSKGKLVEMGRQGAEGFCKTGLTDGSSVAYTLDQTGGLG